VKAQQGEGDFCSFAVPREFNEPLDRMQIQGFRRVFPLKLWHLFEKANLLIQ
jgi:hypothetical protein